MAFIKKLGFTINCFDGCEMLESQLRPIRDQLDYVVACYQNRSYHNNPIDPQDMDELYRLKSLGLIDDLLEYKPDFNKEPRAQETDKRNLSIDFVKEKGCSHVLNADTDELYDPDQFRFAKNFIEEKRYNIVYWSYVNYYKDLDHYLIYPFRPYVNGIHSTFFKYTYNCGGVGVASDPTRRINNPTRIGTYIFEDDRILMCHCSWIKKDIRKKLENWSANTYFTKEDREIAIERYETWQEGMKAKLLFNVPNKELIVKKLDKRIHNIDILWMDNKKEAN